MLGLTALMSLPKESYPEVQLGMVSIATVYPGGNPREIDQLITQKIEKKIKNMDGVKKLTSTSRKNVSSILVELTDKVKATDMSSKIKDAVSQLSFPENVESPTVTEIDTPKDRLFTLLLYAENPAMDQHYLKTKANQLKAELEGKGAIDTIEIEGGNKYTLELLVDKQRIESLGLSLTQIAGQLQSFTSNQPLGNHQLWTMNYDFRIDGELKSEEELQALPILLGGGKSIPLGQLAEIKKVYDDKDSILRVGTKEKGIGKAAVSLTFNKKAGASILSSSKQAKESIAAALKDPEYAELSSFYTLDLGAELSKDYNNLAVNMLSTMLIVFLIVGFFVGAMESFVATVSIPLAFFVTFFVLNYLGLSLNFLTNFSLIICLGIAIDTATVIIQGASENIKLWFSPMHAALLSVRTYKNSLISGTATTVIVFVPMLTLPGIMGKFLSFIPITIFITLLASLFISLTLTPALFSKFTKNRTNYTSSSEDENLLNPEEQALLAEDRSDKTQLENAQASGVRERIFSAVISRYERTLAPLLKSAKTRITLILIPIILLIITVIFVSPRVGFLMMPKTDNEYLTIVLSAKEGTTTETLYAKTQQTESIIGKLPELSNYSWKLTDNTATLSIRIVPKEERERDSFAIEKEIEEQLAFLKQEGITVESKVQSNGPSDGAEIGIKLTASSIDELTELILVVEDFKTFLKGVPWTKNVKSTAEESPGEFVFTLDRQKLALLNLTPRNFAPELYFSLNGIKAGSFTDRIETHDLKIKYADFTKEVSPDNLMGSFFSTQQGKVALASVGSYSFAPAISKISRDNGTITISVQSNLEQGAKAENVNAALTQFAQSYKFPKGVTYAKGGETEDNADLLNAMFMAFLISIIGIFAILVLQFDSYTQPGIILYSVVMGFLGATYGLWIVGIPYGMMFLIWFIALTGIVVNNAIILIDSANENQKLGYSRPQAIKESAKSRLKPILSTTLTTVIGMVTLTGDGMFAPLAWTIIFGLSVATMMTLFVIPALYEDEGKIRYLIARVILKPLVKLMLPTTGLGIVWGLSTMFGTPLFTGAFAMPFSLAFLIAGFLMLNRYGVQCNLQWTPWVVEKLMKLQLTNQQGTALNKKQLIKRVFFKWGPLIMPALLGAVLSGVAQATGIEMLSSIATAIVALLYLIILLGNLYSVWTNDNYQTWRDKRSSTMMKKLDD